MVGVVTGPHSFSFFKRWYSTGLVCCLVIPCVRVCGYVSHHMSVSCVSIVCEFLEVSVSTPVDGVCVCV